MPFQNWKYKQNTKEKCFSNDFQTNQVVSIVYSDVATFQATTTVNASEFKRQLLPAAERSLHFGALALFDRNIGAALIKRRQQKAAERKNQTTSTKVVAKTKEIKACKLKPNTHAVWEGVNWLKKGGERRERRQTTSDYWLL